jgi:predicted CXXCH cytochrome family protein
LQASPGAQAVCEGCHTISDKGNLIEGTAGYDATADERYEDVQCESCHGPGLTHVGNPKDENVPLAPLSVGIDLTTGCGECHADTHHPFVEEWAKSRHGEGANAPQYRTREGCSACHGGIGALAAWGVNTTYLEQGDPGAAIGITCAVCHDPHSAENEHQLRWPIDSRDIDQNLCMKCHQRRAIPDEGSAHGPHSPQGPLLLGGVGSVGWIPPNFEYDADTIAGTHGSERNRELCATCHLNSFTVTDPASGSHLFTATGHLFDPIPCVDAQGIPTGEEGCPMTTAARSFEGCTGQGCHGSETTALTLKVVAETRIHELVEELGALLALVPADQFSTTDDVYTVAEGAHFNMELGEIESSAVHNPFLTEALLRSSIKAVKSTYGLAAQSDVSLLSTFTKPPTLR